MSTFNSSFLIKFYVIKRYLLVTNYCEFTNIQVHFSNTYNYDFLKKKKIKEMFGKFEYWLLVVY